MLGRIVLSLITVALVIGCTPAPPSAGEPQVSPASGREEARETPREEMVLSGRPAETVRETPLVGEWRVQIPAIGVDAPIVAVGLDQDGAMGTPDGPYEVGWYQHGPAPGEQGNVLMDGHVDWTNRQTGVPFGAVFWSLKALDPGERVIITNGRREIVYEVAEKTSFRYDDPAGVSVLQPTDDARLTLITCGGTFDRTTRNYDTREVVIARLIA